MLSPKGPQMPESKNKATILGPMIKQARLGLGINQKELATRIGYNYGNFIGMIENSTAKFPRDAVLKFAEALEIKPEQMIEAWVKENQPDWLPYLEFHSRHESE